MTSTQSQGLSDVSSAHIMQSMTSFCRCIHVYLFSLSCKKCRELFIKDSIVVPRSSSHKWAHCCSGHHINKLRTKCLSRKFAVWKKKSLQSTHYCQEESRPVRSTSRSWEVRFFSFCNCEIETSLSFKLLEVSIIVMLNTADKYWWTREMPNVSHLH